MRHTHNSADFLGGSWRRGDALRLVVVCLLLSFWSVPARATVLINDTFSDGERTSQSLPSSAHWYAGGDSSSVGVTNQALTFNSSNSGVMAYFNAQTLSVGASLTLSFDYKFSNVSNADNAFMFGLYDSTGSQVAKDGVDFNAVTFRNYVGYATSGVFGPDSSGTGLDHIEARNINNKDLLNMDSYTEANTAVQSGAATPSQFYTASMQISRTAAGIVVESKIGNTDMIQTYSSGMFTKFDTVGIFSNGNAGTVTLDNIHLDYMGAPEPSSVFAMAILGMFVFWRPLGSLLRNLVARLVPRMRPVLVRIR